MVQHETVLDDKRQKLKKDISDEESKLAGTLSAGRQYEKGSRKSEDGSVKSPGSTSGMVCLFAGDDQGIAKQRRITGRTKSAGYGNIFNRPKTLDAKAHAEAGRGPEDPHGQRPRPAWRRTTRPVQPFLLEKRS